MNKRSLWATHVVVAQHDSLWVAGGSGRIDETAALVGLETVDHGVQLLLRHILPQLHELGPLQKHSHRRPTPAWPLDRVWTGTELHRQCVYRVHLLCTERAVSAAVGLYTGRWLSGVGVDLSPVGSNCSDALAFWNLCRHAEAANLQDFLELGLVLHHQDVGLTVGSNVLTGLRRVGGVDSSR